MRRRNVGWWLFGASKIAPTLATLIVEFFSRQGWLFEPKWDRERCLAFRDCRHLNLFSRNRIPRNAKYPEVVDAIHQQETTCFIADGEIVTFGGAITSFAKLRRAGAPSPCVTVCALRLISLTRRQTGSATFRASGGPSLTVAASCR